MTSLSSGILFVRSASHQGRFDLSETGFPGSSAWGLRCLVAVLPWQLCSLLFRDIFAESGPSPLPLCFLRITSDFPDGLTSVCFPNSSFWCISSSFRKALWQPRGIHLPDMGSDNKGRWTPQQWITENVGSYRAFVGHSSHCSEPWAPCVSFPSLRNSQ